MKERRSGGPAAITSILVAGLLVTGMVAALGHEATRFDPDDSKGPLDAVAARIRHQRLRQVSSHPERSRRVTELRFRVVTYEKWTRSLLEGEKNFIALEFNLDDDKRIERCLVIRNGEEELLGRLYRGCYRRMELTSAASVTRPDKHTIKTMVDKHQLRRKTTAISSRVTTSFEDPEGDEEDPCRPETSPSPGPYGACRDSTKWSGHRFGRSR